MVFTGKDNHQITTGIRLSIGNVFATIRFADEGRIGNDLFSFNRFDPMISNMVNVLLVPPKAIAVHLYRP